MKPSEILIKFVESGYPIQCEVRRLTDIAPNGDLYIIRSTDMDLCIDLINGCLVAGSERCKVLVFGTHPTNAFQQIQKRRGSDWCGPIWKSVVSFSNRTDVRYVTLSGDGGCTVLWKGKNFNVFSYGDVSGLTWEDFEKNAFMNLVDAECYFDTLKKRLQKKRRNK
jgi:hypothetical protein